MKNVLVKFGIPMTSAVFGGLIAVAIMKHTQDSKVALGMNSTEGMIAPLIKQQQEMQKRIWKELGADPIGMLDIQPDALVPRFVANIQATPLFTSQIQTREDEHFVYFDVKVPDPQSAKIKTELRDGYLTVTGKTEGDVNSNVGRELVVSEFAQTLPLPNYVDVKGIKTEADKSKIVIKFPKLEPKGASSARLKKAPFGVNGSFI